MKRFIVLLAVALMAVPVSASTFVGLTPNQMIRQADAVVIGQVIDQVSSWTDSGRLIYTENTILVEEALFGDVASTVKVRTFGGQVGDIMVEAHGFPKFEQGENVLLFLRHDADTKSVRLLGFQQGHYRVVTRLDGVTLAVPQIEEGTRLLDLQGRQVPEPASVRLGAFKANILKAATELRAIEK